MKLNNRALVITLSVISCLFLPLLAFASQSDGIEGFIDKVNAPVGTLTRLMLFACFVIGVAMFLGGALQYRNHLQSPKLVPLTTPIFLIIFGTIAILLPYFSSLPEHTGSVLKQQKKTSRVMTTTYDDTDTDDEDEDDEEELRVGMAN